MAWSVLALSLGGSSLLYMLIQRGAATRVVSLMYLVPPCTAVMAALLFGEALGASCAGRLRAHGGRCLAGRVSPRCTMTAGHVRRLHAARHRPPRRAPARAPRWRRSAAVAVAWPPADARHVACGGGASGAAVQRRGDGLAWSRRQHAPAGFGRSRAVQQACDGGRRRCRDASLRIRAFRGLRARPRRTRRAPPCARPPRCADADDVARHCAHAGDVRGHHRGLRACLLALVLPDPGCAVARTRDRGRPVGLAARRHGPPFRRPRTLCTGGAGGVRTLHRHAPAAQPRSARTTEPRRR